MMEVIQVMLSTIYQLKLSNEMFDMLDDDLDLGYVPSAPTSKSRSGGMKKLSKKQPKTAPKIDTKANKSKVDDFDDLLDDILEKQTKAIDNKSGGANLKLKKDSFDSLIDEPKPKSVEKPKLKIQEPSTFSPSKLGMRGDSSDEIISEDAMFGRNISKPSLTTINASLTDKAENAFKDSSVSVPSRAMKPPLRKKDSQTSINPNSNFGGFSLTIPQEPTNLSITTKNDRGQEDEEIIRPPPRLMGRRPSVENKSQRNQQSNFSINLKSDSLTLTPEKKENKKDESQRGKGLFLTMNEPQKKKQQNPTFFSFSKDKDSKPSKSVEKQYLTIKQDKKSYERPKQELRIEPKRSGLDMRIDQSVTMKESNLPFSNIVTTKTGVQDYQRQMEMMRGTFQKQLDFLQQNLQKQMTINKQTRNKIINESNQMIEDQRARSKKIYEQQLKRHKQMGEWQQKRMQQNYKAQIQALKQNLQFATKNAQLNNNYRPTNNKEDIEYLQMQLKSQKKILQDRQKMIDQRQRELQERESEMGKRRKREDERLRDEEKKLIEIQAKVKKQSLQEKKTVSEQKQQMAIELATLQMEAMRKIQKAELCLKENRLVRESLEKEKAELRLANAELMSKYKSKGRELDDQRERVKLIQQDLIKKLRVVEFKGREVSAAATVNKTMCQQRQNNWVNQDHNTSNMRAMSVQRPTKTDNSLLQARNTKQRFYNLQSSLKDKLNISIKQNKRFDLQNYMMTVDNYNKLKQHA